MNLGENHTRAVLIVTRQITCCAHLCFWHRGRSDYRLRLGSFPDFVVFAGIHRRRSDLRGNAGDPVLSILKLPDRYASLLLGVPAWH